MYSMRECCRLTGLSYDTLKFYCLKGLIPNVKRDPHNNYRLFDDNDLNWIKSLICLKKCNFSLKEMQTYIELCLQGKASIPARKKMLLDHRQQVAEQINNLQNTLDFIDQKNALYDKFQTGEIPYYSYLIKTE